jgi:hypothetical protein
MSYVKLSTYFNLELQTNHNKAALFFIYSLFAFVAEIEKLNLQKIGSLFFAFSPSSIELN